MIFEITQDDWLAEAKRLQPLVAESRFPVAVTGAGISLASGLPLITEELAGIPMREFFREGLWKSDPERYFGVYWEIIRHWRRVTPNEAHLALARRGISVITQNIDGLHRDAGSERLIELHGNLREFRCDDCSAIYRVESFVQEGIPCCGPCKGVLRPGISFEGQEIRHFALACDWVGRADLLLIVGSAMEMHPVSLLPRIAHRSNADVVWINWVAEKVVPLLCQRVTTETSDLM